MNTMYSTSQFDGAAAFYGGGFMPSQATQTTTSDLSFAPAKNRDTQALLPLTVKQISEGLQSSDEKSNLIVDGVDVNNVTLLGMVFDKAERVTDVSFVLDDGTGRIGCHRWVNEPADTKEMEAILDGMYVRVHGHLKGFQGKKQLSTFSIRPVTDFNEITNHFIECIFVHFYNTRSRIMKVQGGVTAQPQLPNPVMNMPLKGYPGVPPNQLPGQYTVDKFKGVDQMIIDYLQQPSCLAREKGVHKEEIAGQLNIPINKITECLRALEDEGVIYSTIDDFHYKSTGNG